MLTTQSVQGCLLGLALGDALCAPYEGGIVERLAWKIVGKTRSGKLRWTDDTQMSLDIANSLIERGCLDQEHLSRTFSLSYRWSRGYGPGTKRLLKKIQEGAKWSDINCSIYPQGSYGNGAAMRVPVISIFFYNKKDQFVNAIYDSAVVTHAHPLAVEGAGLIASATLYALDSLDPIMIFEKSSIFCSTDGYNKRLNIARKWIENNKNPKPRDIVLHLGNGIAAVESCVTALYIAVRFMDNQFVDMTDFISCCAGDTDTIGAMAGAIWGARNGVDNLPNELLDVIEQSSKIKGLANQLYGFALSRTDHVKDT